MSIKEPAMIFEYEAESGQRIDNRIREYGRLATLNEWILVYTERANMDSASLNYDVAFRSTYSGETI